MDHRIGAILLDEKSVVKRSPEVEQEREVAISDLLENNLFKPKGAVAGPYRLALSVKENRLVFDIARESGPRDNNQRVGRILLSLAPFRRIIKDYFLVCESYYDAIRNATPARSSWDGTRPKRWAITLPVPIMCCPPRGRRVSRPAFRCWIS